MLRYGLDWDDKSNPLRIEMQFIRSGGYMTVKGKTYGEGLFTHYRNLQSLLWPDGEDHHRWSDLMLREILENRITAITGARDSGKTHVALSRYGLTDYFCFPDETLILISSTDIRGLQMRVFGDIKDLHKKALERHPWLPGHVLESKYGIFTDELNDECSTRDMRRGIISIPCLDRKGAWTGGLEKFVGIKQKRRRLLGDECFPDGTLINTPNGLIPIELIRPGDTVLSAIGFRNVIATSSRMSSELVQINLKDGRQITCTPEHEILTQKGWEKACEINEKHYILGSYEAMSTMRNSNQQQESLLSKVLVSDDVNSRRNRNSCDSRAKEKGERQGSTQNDQRQPDEAYKLSEQGECCLEGGGTQANREGREWNRTNESRVATHANVSRGTMELLHQNWEVEWERVSSCVQSGLGIPEHKTSNRSRWGNPHKLEQSEAEGRKEGQVSCGSWVEGYSVLKQDNFGVPFSSGGICRVHNLQVEGHPSYCVNGLVVHNCQFMHGEYLTVLSNLDEGDFKGVFVGNTLANRKALDKISEPVEGWEQQSPPQKTSVFKNKFDGRTIQLIGTDSPNFDYPEDQPTRFKYMVNRQSEKRVGDRWGRNSSEYHSQISGLRKTGMFDNRVLTEDMCKRGRAFESIIWSGEATTKVYACDMAFGGDRAIAGYCEFGAAVGGEILFRVNPPSEIQIDVDSDAEEQIAMFIKKECNALNIPGSHVYFDAGMRATAATALAKLFSPDVNAVNFGGTPTKRPVSADEYVLDIKTGTKTLKRCDQHYDRFISELWFSVRYVVISKQMRELPQDVAGEFYEREWTKEKGDRYSIETKEEMKTRVGFSPDLADWLAIAVEGARRLGFMIESLPDDNTPRGGQDEYLEKELAKYRRERKKMQLSYS